MALQVVGVKVEALGADAATKALSGFDKALNAVQGAIDKVSKTNAGKGLDSLASGATKSSDALSALGGNKITSFLSNLSTQFPQITKQFSEMGTKALANVPALQGMASSMGGITALSPAMIAGIGGAVAAIAALTVAAGVFFKLGSAGAALEPIITAFNNVAGGGNKAAATFNNLKEQTRGTLTDMELLRIGTFALSGASENLSKVLKNDLGNILNNTGRLAQSYGIDVNAAASYEAPYVDPHVSALQNQVQQMQGYFEQQTQSLQLRF